MLSHRLATYYRLPTRFFLVCVLLQHFSKEVAQLIFSFLEWGDAFTSKQRLHLEERILHDLSILSESVAMFKSFLKKSARGGREPYVDERSDSPVLGWWPYDNELFNGWSVNFRYNTRGLRGLVVESPSRVFPNLRNYSPPFRRT